MRLDKLPRGSMHEQYFEAYWRSRIWRHPDTWDKLEGLRELAEREAMSYLVRHRFERDVEID